MQLAIVVMATVRERPRRGLSRAGNASGIPDSIGATDRPGAAGALVPFMCTNVRTLGAIFAAFSLGGIAVVGYLAWLPELIRRSYGWDVADVGCVFGQQMAIFGTARTLVGGACCASALAFLVWGRPAYRDSVRRARQWQEPRVG